MFGIMSYVIIAIAIIVFATTIIGFFKVSRFAGKIFHHVENQLDRQLNDATGPQAVACNYCGAEMKATANCPKCGAPRA